MKAGAGIVVVAAHLAGFAVLAARSAGSELTVDVATPLASEKLTLEGGVPDALADRVTVTVDGTAGLVRKRWHVGYRGGFAREVGATQLVGPFQQPGGQPACSGRVVVGQELLDDGVASPGTIAGATLTLLDTQLAGLTLFALGTYQRVEHLSLRWARLETQWFDRALVGPSGAPHGYVRATATVVFDRVAVPIVMALIPEPPTPLTRELHFRTAAFANLDFDNRVVQWASDKVGADKLATRLANQQIDAGLVTTLAPPPPLRLAHGLELRFAYCADPIEIADHAWGALPFGVEIGTVPHQAAILPPHVPSRPRAVPSPHTTLAIDLDLDALNALLFELWRTGILDDKLAEVGLDRSFNADPIVTEYLSIRLSPLRLALPPVVSAGPRGMRLAADARVAIGDDALEASHVTTGRVYGALDFHFTPGMGLAVDLGALELACERTPTTLVPCYGDLVSAIADRGAEFHGALTAALGKLLTELFVDRHISAGQLPAEIAIHRVTPSVAANGGSLHLELDASLVRTPRAISY